MLSVGPVWGVPAPPWQYIANVDACLGFGCPCWSLRWYNWWSDLPVIGFGPPVWSLVMVLDFGSTGCGGRVCGWIAWHLAQRWLMVTRCCDWVWTSCLSLVIWWTFHWCGGVSVVGPGLGGGNTCCVYANWHRRQCLPGWRCNWWCRSRFQQRPVGRCYWCFRLGLSMYHGTSRQYIADVDAGLGLVARVGHWWYNWWSDPLLWLGLDLLSGLCYGQWWTLDYRGGCYVTSGSWNLRCCYIAVLIKSIPASISAWETV